MKRDPDYLRTMLIDFEASSDWQHLVEEDKNNVEKRTKYYNALLAEDLGYLNAITDHTGPDSIGRRYYRVTSEGYDFIDTTRDKVIWEKTKGVARDVGGLTIKAMQELAFRLVQQKLNEYAGS